MASSLSVTPLSPISGQKRNFVVFDMVGWNRREFLGAGGAHGLGHPSAAGRLCGGTTAPTELLSPWVLGSTFPSMSESLVEESSSPFESFAVVFADLGYM